MYLEHGTALHTERRESGFIGIQPDRFGKNSSRPALEVMVPFGLLGRPLDPGSGGPGPSYPAGRVDMDAERRRCLDALETYTISVNRRVRSRQDGVLVLVALPRLGPQRSPAFDRRVAQPIPSAASSEPVSACCRAARTLASSATRGKIAASIGSTRGRALVIPCTTR